MKHVFRARPTFLVFAFLLLLVGGRVQAAAKIEFTASANDRSVFGLKRSEGSSIETVAVSRDQLRSHLRNSLRIEDSYFENLNETEKFKQYANPHKLTVRGATIRRFEGERLKLMGIIGFFERRPLDSASKVTWKK